MSVNWTPCKVQRLFELLLENYENLFHSSAFSSQRKLKKETFEKIATLLGMPFPTLKYKYFNLNNAYNAELKKIEKGKNRGFFYRPTLPWFNQYREIMEKVDGLNKANASTIENNECMMDDFQEDDSLIAEEELETEEDEAPQPETSANAIVVSIKQECIDEVKKGSLEVDFEESHQPVQAIEPIESSPVQKTLPPKKIAYVVRRGTKRALESGGCGIDEFQLFANHVAQQLRNMTINSARKIQSEIHIIFDEEGFPFYSPVLDDI